MHGELLLGGQGCKGERGQLMRAFECQAKQLELDTLGVFRVKCPESKTLLNSYIFSSLLEINSACIYNWVKNVIFIFQKKEILLNALHLFLLCISHCSECFAF